MKKFIILIFIPIILLVNCQEKSKRQFIFCKENQNNGKDLCIPPILKKKVTYIFDLDKKLTPNTIASKVYFLGDTLSFEYKNVYDNEIQQLEWKNNFKIKYNFTESKKLFKFERIDFHKKSVTGFSLIGTILENYISTQEESKKSISPIIMQVNMYLDNRKLGHRTIIIYIDLKHDD